MKKVNKFLIFAIVLSLVFTLFLVSACDGEENSPNEWTININFNTNTDESLDDLEVTIDEDTEEITLPSAPSKAGYTFEGWYLDSDFEV